MIDGTNTLKLKGFEFLDEENQKELFLNHPYRNYKNFVNDYKYCYRLFINLKKKLYKKLNFIHKVSQSEKYWDNLIGLWLFRHVMIFKESWTCFQQIKIDKNFKYEFFDLDFSEAATNYSIDFFKGIYSNDQIYYQNYIYNLIFKFNKINNVNFKKFTKKKISDESLKIKKNFFFLNLISKIIIHFKKNFEIISVNALHLETEIKGYLKNFIPYLHLDFHEEIKFNNYDYEMRKWKILDNDEDDFQNFISENIPKLIPKILIENFVDAKKIINKKFPINIKNLLKTSTDFDLMNLFVSEQIDKGAKIHLFQHGANYGQIDINPEEDVDLLIADKFYTFGWDEYDLTDKNFKVVPFYPINIAKLGKNKKKTNNKKISLVLKCEEKFFYEYKSIEQNFHQNDYLKTMQNLYNNLEEKVIDNFSLRIHPDDNLKNYEKKFPSIKIDDGKENIINYLKKINLCVLGHNSTILLQSFALNIPTILIFSKNIVFREKALKYYQFLEEANILFYDEINAAKFINKIYPDLNSWWYSKKTQENKNLFCRRFLDTQNPQKKFNKLLKNIMQNEKYL